MKMTLFEVMTALSATFAFAVPTFMEKVMRPKYEERFSEFRKARREVFMDEFETAYNQLKEAKEEMTPEIVETMERVVNEWGEVKTDESKLDSLLKYRKYFLFGWLFVCILSLFSIEFSETVVPVINNGLGSLTTLLFLLWLGFSAFYCWELFRFDEKLSAFKSETTGETFGKIEHPTISVAQYLGLEKKVEDALQSLRIRFAENVSLKTDGLMRELDFVVPDVRNPKYIIEVKARLTANIIYTSSRLLEEIKRKTRSKTILVSNFREASSAMLAMAAAYWDFTVDFQNLDKLKEIIKL